MLQNESNHRFNCVECQFAYGECAKSLITMYGTVRIDESIHREKKKVGEKMLKLQTTFSIIAKTPNHDQNQLMVPVLLHNLHKPILATQMHFNYLL